MRRIALINQKGGVGKTTTTVNLGAALARAGRRVVLVDLDAQANLSLHVDLQIKSGEPSTYTVLLGNGSFAAALRDTRTPNLRVLPANIDLSGAELELANAFGREMLLRDAIDAWEKEGVERDGRPPADYLLFDCPPSLGLLAVNGLVAASETVIAVQTEFFALQGLSKLSEVVQLLRRRLNPKLEITGILPCLYDNRTKLAREVLAELRSFFPGKVFARSIAKNIKLAEAPSFGQTIFEYAPDSSGALDYELLAADVIAQEARDADLTQRFPPIVAAANGVSTRDTQVELVPRPRKPARVKDAATPRASTSTATDMAPIDELPELPPDAVLLPRAGE